MFYDETHSRERVDTVVTFEGETWFLSSISDFALGVQWDMFFQDATAMCFDDKNFTHHMEKPDFSNFVYVGASIFMYEPVLMWGWEDSSRKLTFGYMEYNETGRPARFDMHDKKKGFTVEWQFTEFDKSKQDKTLFEIPSVIANICNPF